MTTAFAYFLVGYGWLAGLAHGLVIYNNSNNMYSCITGPGDSTEQLVSLGKKQTLAECEQAFSSDSRNFRSFVYYPASFDDNDWRRYCYARTDTWWSPVAQDDIISGQISNFNDCFSNSDCELNGVCVNKKCECKAMWTGTFCQYLHFKRGSRALGYQRANYSQWGGSAIYDASTQQWNLFAAEMYAHCGINTCCDIPPGNSQIVRALSDSPGGPYTFDSIAVPYFAHEPMIVYSPEAKKFLLYHWGSGDKSVGVQTAGCIGGYTNGYPPQTAPAEGPLPTGGAADTFISTADSLAGPWSIIELPDDPGGELCLSNPNLFANGSVFMAWTFRSSWDQGSCTELVHCDAWNKNCHFPNVIPGRCNEYSVWITELADKSSMEDPYMWMDATDGTWHLLMHGMIEVDNPGGNPWLRAAQGRHGYSPDGVHWTLSPHYTYNTTICYDDNTCVDYARRERPHLIRDPDTGEPLYLTNGMKLNNLDEYDKTFFYAAPLYTSSDLCQEGQQRHCH